MEVLKMYIIINNNKNSIFKYTKPYVIQNTATKQYSKPVTTKEEATQIINTLYKYGGLYL